MTRIFRRAFVAVAVSAVLLAVGCGRPHARLELTSFKDPYFPETYCVDLNQCAYYQGPSGDYHIVGRAENTPAEGEPSVTQIIHIHMFWQPRPGKTVSNSTSVDAVIRYAILTDQGAALYSGTGFVYPKKRRMSDDIIAKLEVGRLRIDQEVGEAPELLGAARVVGTLVSQPDAAMTVDLRRQIDVRFGPPEAR